MPQPITEADVRHAAKLSRLALTDGEVAHFTGQLAAVLEHIAVLNELDVDEVEPLAGAIDRRDVTRPDRESPGMDIDAALANAPQREGAFFKVPKVLG